MAAAILLVDDEHLVRPVVANSLRRAGHDVTEAGSADAALAVVADRQRPLDLLITDVRMPGMHGIELTRRARLLRPGLPVLLVSGSPELPVDTSGSDDPLLVKPFGRGELLAAIDDLLARDR